jgi:glycosyltransferase involved in cell wall biosynthesis
MRTKHSAGAPVVVVASQPSNWTSNRVISPNLRESYRRLWGEGYDVLSLPIDGDETDIRWAARALAARRPDRLVFVDHLPHPAALLEQFTSAWEGRRLPALYFHLYGDFTLQLKNWLALEPLLKRASVSWICASDRQAALVGRLLAGPRRAVSLCPFPVDASFFAFDPALRARARARLGVRSDARVLVYAGRFSLQKNSARMLGEAARFLRRKGPPTQLMLAGSFDDIGAPFFGIHHLPGYYFQVWNQTLRALPPEVSRRVRYLGRLDAARLRDLYHAADCYFSLSLHHDEDFGMAPAEALSCGTSAVLTDWGGFTSFQSASSHCRLIPVSLGSRELRFSSADVQQALRAECRENPGPEERRARAARFLSGFSIESAVEKLRRIHRRPPPRFCGFDALLPQLCRAQDTGAYFPEGPGKSRLYPKLYRAYYSRRTVVAE